MILSLRFIIQRFLGHLVFDSVVTQRKNFPDNSSFKKIRGPMKENNMKL